MTVTVTSCKPVSPDAHSTSPLLCPVTQIIDGQIQAPVSCLSAASSIATTPSTLLPSIPTFSAGQPTTARSTSTSTIKSTVTITLCRGVSTPPLSYSKPSDSVSTPSALIPTTSVPELTVSSPSTPSGSTHLGPGSSSPSKTLVSSSEAQPSPKTSVICPVTQIEDGQIQAPLSCYSVVDSYWVWTGPGWKQTYRYTTTLAPPPESSASQPVDSATATSLTSDETKTGTGHSSHQPSPEYSSITARPIPSTPEPPGASSSHPTPYNPGQQPSSTLVVTNDASVEDAGAALAVIGSVLQLTAVIMFLYVDFVL